ncbi:MAG: hypothetical protein ACXW31_05725, partial [Thermoanaerobaculia bacterium]
MAVEQRRVVHDRTAHHRRPSLAAGRVERKHDVAELCVEHGGVTLRIAVDRPAGDALHATVDPPAVENT